jgi:dTDP-L-rhamnose 4-epimerase
MPDSPGLGTVLVTGGAGFIGCALARQLAASSSRWVVVDSLHRQVHPTGKRPADLVEAAELVVDDVTSPLAFADLLADLRPDVVLHLAAETGTAQSLDESTRHGLVNVVGTTRLLDGLTAAAHRPAHLVLTSSRAIYGEGSWRREDGTVFQPGARTHAQLEAAQWDFPGAVALPSVAGSTVPAPSSVYGATKLAQEHVLAAWAGARDVPLSVLRLQNVYGPGQSLTNSYTGIVSLFSQLARSGSAIPVYEDGAITRDFVYIDDVAEAIAAASLAPPASGRRTLDIGTGVATTIHDLATTISAFYDSPAPRVTGQFRDGDVRHASCSVEAATADLGWRPSWSLADGVAALQEWIGTQLEA